MARAAASVWAGVGLASALGLHSSDATAQGADKHACFVAHEQAQLLRNDGKFRDAREQLLVCAREMCPLPLRKECAQWIGEVDAAQPSVVVEARDPRGDLAQVRVFVDGTKYADSLDGRSFAVDPGPHLFRFETADGRVVERKVVVVQGEKDRRLSVELAPPAAAQPTPQPSPRAAAPLGRSGERKGRVPVLTWVFTGIGVVGLGSFGYFAYAGYHQEKDLASSCAPSCSQSAIDGVHTRYVIADVSLGVGVVALGAAALILLLRHDAPARTVDWLIE